MSRSRKKVAGYTDRNPWMKNYANRRFRRIDCEKFDNRIGTMKSRRHRKFTCPWNICDFKQIYHTERTVIENSEKYDWMPVYKQRLK